MHNIRALRLSLNRLPVFRPPVYLCILLVPDVYERLLWVWFRLFRQLKDPQNNSVDTSPNIVLAR